MMLTALSCILFALGMCMTLLPEWNSFKTGVLLGIVGIILEIITVFIWRKMEHKPPIKLSGKRIAIILFAVFGALTLGVGMCLCLVWGSFVLGTVIGFAGIFLLLLLVPILKGLR